MTESRPDPRLLEATVAVLADSGWDGVTLEKVAERAGRSRSTVWRQGVTIESLLAALLDDLADDFRRALWPVLNAEDDGRRRLEAGLRRLCGVIDRHLALVLASDTVFHQSEPGIRPINYLEPFRRFVREGQADGSLAGTDDPDRVAELGFNAVAWTYTHLRGRHAWAAEPATDAVVGLVLHGLVDPTA